MAAEKWAPAVSPKEVEGVPGFPGPEVFGAELYLVSQSLSPSVSRSRCTVPCLWPRPQGPSPCPGAMSPRKLVLTPKYTHTLQVELLALLQYDDAQIQAQTPFLAVDVEFNAILAISDVSLAAMGKVLQLHSSVRVWPLLSA